MPNRSVGAPSSETMELLEAAENAVLFTAVRPAVIMEKGEGMYLWDTEGRSYLDFIGGWAVNALGHSPHVIQVALAAQSAQLVNASPGFYNKPMAQFAKQLTELTVFDRVFFGSSGAEANESAIKLARKYGAVHRGGAYEIITTLGGFHGRTLAMMSATGKPYWEPLFAPKVPGFRHVPFNDLDAMREAVSEQTCAIMIEPVQGEGGVHLADPAYVTGLRELCDEHGILLIFDEIQTGLGRTGKLFAYEHYGVEPDIMTLGKGIGGGFPLSAMLTKERYNLFEPGEQGGTYTGQPLAMAVGQAVVRAIVEQQLSENAKELGEYLQAGLKSIAKRYQLANIRGLGLLIAFDLSQPAAPRLAAAAMENGLIINASSASVIRLIPPLIVSHADVDEMLKRLCLTLDAVQHV
ncbi:acetylornithine/N-succinyldiaminopimelate aminotransferase [Paenibacillus cellulosilyticus]|uniref:Acetylornithine aminotransferase n=1 Tax=Paenibacillus cellulosilyticus TaxID=375489 RepID=A0A2V2YVX2_9BACL|nr:acetylornithine/succinylornithine family transaminase [Paenibacillus cellulosilyticus]PWW05249.1 acetylornithine/N-succinyldiaminopimelate aminotransferase [Paenibacillus cellulosilyticus]QKS43573.1 acetylornithine/succinylornithine family transaminase [Paenibacillus cellulosilyticus]